MLVIRVFDVLEGLAAQFAVHTTCCTSGTCPEPDHVAYQAQHDSGDGWREPGPVIAEIVHEYLSASNPMALSLAVQNHPNTYAR